MPSQFENAGLGMFRGEHQFARGGPVNDLIKMLPAAGLAYGLVKSGAVDKLNAGKLFSNPANVLGNAITNSAPAPTDSELAPVAAPTDNAPNQSVVPPEAASESGTTFPVNKKTTILNALPPAKSAPSTDELVDHVINDHSGLSPNLMKPDRSQDADVLQNLYTSNPNAASSVGQGGGGSGNAGTQIAMSLVSKILPMFLG